MQEDILASALEGDAPGLHAGEGFSLEAPQGLEWRAQGQGEVSLFSAGAADLGPPEGVLGKLPTIGACFQARGCP